LTGRLADAEREAFGRDGFVQINRPVLSADKFSRLKAIFEESLAEFGPNGLDVPHFRDSRLLEFLLADEVLDLVEPLIGPDIGLWSSHFISKSPRTGVPTPWHEDSAYWDDRVSAMDGIVTVWLAIDPTDRSNGSMGVIPGTQRSNAFTYETVNLTGEVFDRQIVASEIDTATAVYASLAPNECTLHNARIVHGAEANRSDRRRAGYTMRYFPTTARVIPEANRNHAVWLARGRDRANNSYSNRHTQA
jgi:ectoine hydroxylase-related dioxygenase (phytanoyl-CoA dioxygenase family)